MPADADQRRTWLDRMADKATGFLQGVRAKSYSLVPVERTQNYLLKPFQRPNDELMLRAFGDNPVLRIKYNRLCSSMASLDVKLFEKTQDGTKIPLIESYPMYQLLRRPNPLMFGWDFRFLTELYIRVAGACFWRPVFDIFGVPRQLWIYPAHWVIIIRNPRTWEIVYYDVRQPNGYIERLGPHELLWLRSPDPLNPYFKGLGEVNAFATELDTYELASEADRRFFENDATPKGALVVPGAPQPDEVRRIKDTWKSAMGSPENYGETVILSGGMDYKTFREGRREMDFIEGQKWLRDMILLGVHPHIIGISENVNRANAEAAEYTFGKWELAPRVIWWEEVYNTMLAPYFHESVVAEIQDPIPENTEFKLKRSQVGVQVGAITRNEWRKDNDYELLPSELGDVFIMSPMVQEEPAYPMTADEEAGVAGDESRPGGRPEDVVDPSIGQPIRRPGQEAPPGGYGGGRGQGGGQGGTPGGVPEITGVSPTGPAGAQAPVPASAGRREPIRRKAVVRDTGVTAYKAFAGEFARLLEEKFSKAEEVFIQPPIDGEVVWFSTPEDARAALSRRVRLEKSAFLMVVRACIPKSGTREPVRVERAE